MMYLILKETFDQVLLSARQMTPMGTILGMGEAEGISREGDLHQAAMMCGASGDQMGTMAQQAQAIGTVLAPLLAALNTSGPCIENLTVGALLNASGQALP